MKKSLISIIFIFIIFNLNSQTPYKNYQKYKYLRNRFRNDFVIADPTNRQGTNIPAARRNEYGGTLSYGQNPMCEGISPYLMLLATEYAVNKKYGFDNTQTLNELSYVLLAIERLDLNVEKFIRAEINNIEPDTITFWSDIDNYKYAEDLNGFFMRDDIDGVHKDNEYRYYTEDPTRFIYNYNDEQLKTSTYFNSPITKAGRTFYHGFKMDDEETPSNRFNVHERLFMSQDEVAPLFLSLALVAKLVDDNRLYTDTEGEQVTIGRWCGKIAYRTMKALYNENSSNWHIYNPITLENLPDHNDFDNGSNGTNTY